MRVLIAEDDMDLRKLLRVYLGRGGHEVVEATNGLEAWNLLQEEHLRLLIVDWMMPTMDGPELIRRIRGAGWPGYTYIIILTARSTPDDIITGLNVGADDYLTKPFNRGELIARLGVGERILDLEARLSAALAHAEELATHDSLTGLLNRRALYEYAHAELNRAVRKKTSFSLVMMDIDYFKAVNDQYGHLVGDQALCLLAEVLKQNKRNYDYAGRWGGEEFMAVLPATSLPEAELVAERLRASVAAARLPLLECDSLQLRVSLGVTSTAGLRGPVTLDVLLQQADVALYQAKAAGRNRVCLYQPPAADGDV